MQHVNDTLSSVIHRFHLIINIYSVGYVLMRTIENYSTHKLIYHSNRVSTAVYSFLMRLNPPGYSTGIKYQVRLTVVSGNGQ
jgi:hypothetical protein